MKRNFTVTLLLVAFFGLINFNSYAQQTENKVLPGVYWIKIKPSAQENLNITKSARTGNVSTGIQALNNLNTTFNVTEMKRLFPYSATNEGKHMKHGLHLWYELTVKASVSATSIVNDYAGLDEVEIAEPVYLPVINDGSGSPAQINGFESAATQEYFNDPYLKKQWHYNNTGQTGGTPGMDINLYKAWQIAQGSPNVIVSVHDQGVDYRHEDLAEMMWVNEAEKNGKTGVDDDGNGFIDDINGFNFSSNDGRIDIDFHGTHVAGTVAAKNNNGIGVSGIAGGSGNGDGVRIMTCQILGGAHAANIPLSYVFAADNGAVISQNSWGYMEAEFRNKAVEDAIDYFIAEAGDFPGSPMKGGVVIFAAGNINTSKENFPGAYSPCIAVASLDAMGTKPVYSNYGTWIDIAAPGGDSDDNATLIGSYSNGVLSTLDDNGYGYLDGTSMACPHVSGVAALVVSKYGGPGFTNEKLKAHLLTGVRNIYDIEKNSSFIGMLGAGIIDAELALARDNKIAPKAITDLNLAGISQDFASLSWKVPADEDDGNPLSFEVIYSKVEINAANLAYANSFTLKNTKKIGETVECEIQDLQSLTPYYFSVRAIDRWGNIADFSNAVKATTNSGPITSFSQGKDTLNITIDVTRNSIGKDSVKLINSGEGTLKWTAEPRHKDAVPLSKQPEIRYPEIAINSKLGSQGIKSLYAATSAQPFGNIQKEQYNEKGYANLNYPLMIIGETNTEIPNSSATRFYVGEEAGFNLTHVEPYLIHDEKTGPVILEIYKGSDISDAKLLLAQEIEKTNDGYTFIDLQEQLFFEKGEYFWVVFHVPAGNKFPLGAAMELNEEDSKNCYMSLNGGKTWSKFEELYYDNQVVWAVFAISQYQKIDKYVVLAPFSGTIASGKDTTIVASVDASGMINGVYNANLVVNTNETAKPIIRIPVKINITGHKPEITSTRRINFGNVIVGNSKVVKVVIQNKGLGRFNFKFPELTIDDPQFSYISGISQKFEAMTSQELTFRYTASKVGNNSCNVTLLDENGNNYTFELFAAGLEPPVIELKPKTITYNNLSIGDTIKGQVLIKNKGNYPLDYYLPMFGDGSNMESAPENIHKFGYSVEVDTLGSTYVWNDISSTGTDVTSTFSGNYSANMFHKFSLDFMFPYFGKNENYVYITKYGLLAFTENKHMESISPSFYNFPGNPDRYISGCGFPMVFDDAGFGKVYYKQESDRFIVQYDDAPFWDGYNFEDTNEGLKKIKTSITFQIVLFDNGNISMYYKDCTLPDYWRKNYTLIAMEDKTTEDGILISGVKHKDWGNPVGDFLYQRGSAIHIKSPGLGLFSNITKPYGTVKAKDSVLINYQIKTLGLSVLPYNENLVIITNDPKTNPAIHTVNFEITKGGAPDVSLDKDSLNFGTLFKGTELGKTIFVSNTGNAIDSITKAVFVHDYFNLKGNIPCILKPGRQMPLVIKAKTLEVGNFSDTLQLTLKSGKVLQVELISEVILGPVFNLLNASGTTPLKSVTRFLAAGKNTNVGFKIHNSGSADLKVAPFNNEWASITETVPSDVTDSIDYMVQKSNSSTGVQYEWIDVQGNNGTKVKGIDPWNGKNWSEGIKMPFTFNFYGINYDTIYIGNGLVTFTKGQDKVSYFWGGGPIPDTIQPNNYIAPLFLFGGADWDQLFPETGIYYQFDEDKIVIEFHEFNSNFVMGPPISFEVILYPSGNIKMQYKMPEQGDNTVTNQGVIGIENASGTAGKQVSYWQFIVNSDMAIGYYPSRSYTIPPGETKDFNMLLDAQYLVEGSYTDSLLFLNNDPYSLNHKLPTKLVVTGVPKIEIPADLEFGDVIINPEVTEVTREFEIKNTGTASFILSGLKHKDAGVEIEARIKNNGNWSWTDLDLTPSALPLSIPAKSSLKLKATITPEKPVTIRDTMVLSTSLTPSLYRIPVNAGIFNSAVIDLNTDTISVYAQTSDFTVSKERQIGNDKGGYRLDYKANIIYFREKPGVAYSYGKPQNIHAESQGNSDSLISLASVSDNSALALNSEGFTANEYNRVLSLDTASVIKQQLGYSGARTFYAATGFNAPSNGFNLTHVQNWFVPGEWLNSKIRVMILAGDNDINNCEVLLDESFEHNTDKTDDKGLLLTYKLSKNIEIYPNEKFYIVFGYEAGLLHPQGCVLTENTIPNRYMFGAGPNLGWNDLSEYKNFSDIGYMMRAVEETANDVPWVILSSDEKGTLEHGQTTSLKVDFSAASADKRDNFATLFVTSNDIASPVKKVVLHLAKNAGASFDIPKNLTVLENDTLVFTVMVTDLEGDSFSVSIDQEYEYLKLEKVEEGINQNNRKYKMLSFVYTPGFDSQGTHRFGLTSIDEFNNETKSSVSVQVNNVNRWPLAIPMDTLRFIAYGNYKIVSTVDLFTDSDNDIELLEGSTGSPQILNLYNSGNSYLMMPQEKGLTSVTFMATDKYGMKAVNTVQVLVTDETTAVLPEFGEQEFNVYPNPTKGDVHITMPAEINGDASLFVFNSSGTLVKEMKPGVHPESMISFSIAGFPSGLYLIKLVSGDMVLGRKIIKQ